MTSYNRRTFLRASAASAATLAMASTRAATNQPPSENIHVALIGAGSQGFFDMTNLLKVPGVKLTAVCEINPYNIENVKHLAPDVTVYDNWEELLAKETDLQAALVALPEDTHAPATIAALEAGLNVFCEKPMAYSLDQSRAMIAARDKSGSVLQIGQQRRSNPLYYLAERLIHKDGVLGEVLRIDTFWDRWADWKREVPQFDRSFSKWGYPTPNHLINWRLYRKYGHGLITENGTHQLDASTWMLGGRKASKVCGLGAIRYNDGRETHDICSAEYMFAGDTIVRFTQDFHQGLNYGWSYGELILGSEAALRITAEQDLVIYDRNRKATKISIEQLGEIELSGVVSTVADMKAAEDNRQGGGMRTYSYDHEMRIFTACVRNGNKPTCTGEIGHNAIALTVTGSEAQYSGEMKHFQADMFL
jgi:predicted dehydrogenase